MFLMIGYLLLTTGELFISPIGLSKVTELSPKVWQLLWWASISCPLLNTIFVGNCQPKTTPNQVLHPNQVSWQVWLSWPRFYHHDVLHQKEFSTVELLIFATRWWTAIGTVSPSWLHRSWKNGCTEFIRPQTKAFLSLLLLTIPKNNRIIIVVLTEIRAEKDIFNLLILFAFSSTTFA